MDQQRVVRQRIVMWKRQHLHYEPNLNVAVHTRLLHYNNELLQDLQLNPYHKANKVQEIASR